MSAAMERIANAPGFYRRGSRVVFPYRDARGKRRWASARNLTEARKAKAAILTDVGRGEHTPRGRETFAEYARAWIDTYAGRTSRGLAEHTRDSYRRRLEGDAIPFLGRMRLTEITPADVREYAATIERRGVAPDTVRLGVAPVRALLATAVEEGLLRSNPAAGLRLRVRRDAERDRAKALSDKQLAALLAELPDEWRPFFAFLAETGLRVGEAIELRWNDLELGSRTLTVSRTCYEGRVGSPKSRYGRRRLRLTPAMAQTLWQRQARSHADAEGLVWTSSRGQRISQASLMRDVLKPAASRAGIVESVGFHTFRHTCATLLFARGWNVVQVQRWLGHHRPSFTLDTYVHLLADELPEPADLGSQALLTQGVNSSVNQSTQTDAKSALRRQAEK